VRDYALARPEGGRAQKVPATQLFRHPLGLPLPHTAIIPNNKDRIAEGIVRVNSIVRFGSAGAGGSLLFLLMNRTTEPRFDAENGLYLFALTMPFSAQTDIAATSFRPNVPRYGPI
jgi:hypothetical protein